MSVFVRHLHDFMREAKLTEEEFHTALGYVVAIGKHSNESHNEAVLMAGSLGCSALVCLLNNGAGELPRPIRTCWGRSGACTRRSRRTADRSCARPRPDLHCLSMPGSAIATGRPIVGAEVDVWHSSPEGFYENQDPVQADMNLRGKFFTDQEGHISFRSVKPAGYPIPIDGPTGSSAARTRPPQYAARAFAFPRQQGRLQDADLTALRAGRQVH